MSATAFEPIPNMRSVDVTKAQLAEMLGEPIAKLDGWVRNGCPCRRTGSVRSPLVFDFAQVVAWLTMVEAEKRGGPNAVKMVRLMLENRALEYELERRKPA